MAENEYIERSALDRDLQKLVKEYNRNCESDKSSGAFEALYRLRLAPAADVVEVRHGEWIIKTNYKTPVSHAYIRKEKLYICPYCGKDYRQHMNFCGNCGARMDGGKHETG